MQENAGLRAQISQVMVERDDLEQRLNTVSYNYDKLPWENCALKCFALIVFTT